MPPEENAPPHYEVRLTEPAEMEIEAHHDRISSLVSEEFAGRWQDALFVKLNDLALFPRSYPVAPENDLYDVEIRRLLFYGPSGRRKNGVTYRVWFLIVEPNPLEPVGIVRVLHIVHGAQKPTA